MKFLCIACDEQMDFEQRALPGDGTFAAVFCCPKCKQQVAMLANPMETQLVNSMGVKIGGRTLQEQPLEQVRGNLVGREDAFQEAMPASDAALEWTPAAEKRLSHVPGFVRGMVKKIYAEYAHDHGIDTITPAVMTRARNELGLEGM